VFEVKLVVAFVCLVQHLHPVFFGADFLLLWVGVGTGLTKVIGGSVGGVYHTSCFTELGGVHVPGEGPCVFGVCGVDVKL